MNRDELKQQVRNALIKNAPDIGIAIAERIIELPRVQAWFDSIERRRPRGIVAWVRRLRGKHRGLSAAERQELQELVRDAVAKAKR